VNVFYVSIKTTENYEFDKIRTAGVTGNATEQPQSYMFNQRWNFTTLPVIFTTSRHWWCALKGQHW